VWRHALTALGRESDDSQSRHTPKIAHVAGRDTEAVCERRGCNPEVVAPDHGPPPGKSRPNIGMDSSDHVCDRNRLELSQEVFNEGTSPRPARSCRTEDALQELAHRDHADCSFLVADHGVDLCPAPLRSCSISRSPSIRTAKASPAAAPLLELRERRSQTRDPSEVRFRAIREIGWRS
jgi:hypothetical protein